MQTDGVTSWRCRLELTQKTVELAHAGHVFLDRLRAIQSTLN
jgi:hypothetical protein